MKEILNERLDKLNNEIDSQEILSQIYRCRFKLENKYLKEYGCYEYKYENNRIYYYIVRRCERLWRIHGLIENQIFILDDKYEGIGINQIIGIYDDYYFNYYFEDLRLQDERKEKIEKLNSLNESNNNR